MHISPTDAYLTYPIDADLPPMLCGLFKCVVSELYVILGQAVMQPSPICKPICVPSLSGQQGLESLDWKGSLQPTHSDLAPGCQLRGHRSTMLLWVVSEAAGRSSSADRFREHCFMCTQTNPPPGSVWQSYVNGCRRLPVGLLWGGWGFCGAVC